MKFLISLFLAALLFASTLAHGQAWQGQWITAPTAKNTPNGWLAFTTDVPVAQVPAQARLRIAADSKY